MRKPLGANRERGVWGGEGTVAPPRDFLEEPAAQFPPNHLLAPSGLSDPWSITLLETGLDSLTGSRIKLAEKVINNQPFMLTYGDGVSDINIPALIECLAI
ncbi:MAG: hypothetical protein HYW48_03575 [Deltaproteobacteria bacterium]|nr:hypothetical protein [Deltaproteobacteria bacterium]